MAIVNQDDKRSAVGTPMSTNPFLSGIRQNNNLEQTNPYLQA